MSRLPASPKASHPRWLRLTHWLNALAVLVMVTSGWRIYNASPLYDFSFPASITLGGWLGGALQWHFAAMWFLAINGLVYLVFNLFSGRLKRRFFPVSPQGVLHDLWAALRGRAGACRPESLQPGATGGVPVRDGRHHAAGDLRAGAVEVGAVPAAA